MGSLTLYPSTATGIRSRGPLIAPFWALPGRSRRPPGLFLAACVFWLCSPRRPIRPSPSRPSPSRPPVPGSGSSGDCRGASGPCPSLSRTPSGTCRSPATREWWRGHYAIPFPRPTEPAAKNRLARGRSPCRNRSRANSVPLRRITRSLTISGACESTRHPVARHSGTSFSPMTSCVPTRSLGQGCPRGAPKLGARRHLREADDPSSLARRRPLRCGWRRYCAVESSYWTKTPAVSPPSTLNAPPVQ